LAEEESLITHITHYFDEKNIPFAIKIHNIPESRAPQEYLDALVSKE